MQKNSQSVAFDSMMEVISEKLSVGGDVLISASGDSMYPLFRHQKDQVRLSRVERTLKKYDMILYRRDNGQYVLHRIVGIGENGFILRGDAQLVNEYPVREDQVIAKVSGFVRNGKEYTCQYFFYRLYAYLWTNTVLMRKILGKCKRMIRRIIHYKQKE